MRTKEITISRTTGSGNGMQQYPLRVAEAARDSWLQRVKPSYREQHAVLLREAVERMRYWKENFPRNGSINDSEFIENFSSYRLSTLEMFRQIDTGSIGVALFGTEYNESSIRELASYWNLCGDMRHPRLKVLNALNDVRESAPRFHLEDLSSLEGSDRDHAERIMQMSMLLWQFDYDKTPPPVYNPQDGVWEHSEERDVAIFARKHHVSPALAEVLRERSQAIDAMPSYLEHFPVPVTEEEAQHFKRFSDMPVMTLAVGAL
jgi:hypothetical protein